jgi:outer membrane receptor protein involved in Fe transport
MTDLQVAKVDYHVIEDVPSSNNYPDDPADHGGETWTGTATWDHDSDTLTADVPVEYTLWDYERSFSYLSPKFGANYNLNDNLNVFANFSRAVNEPRVKFFFGYGSPNEDLELETTNDIELGGGYLANIAGMDIDAKLNWYYIMFENKALRVTDPTMANKPGYDYKGRRYIPIGSSIYSGTELAVNLSPFAGLSLGLNLTMASNEWGEPDDSEGAQYLYSKDDVVAGTDYTDTDDDGKWGAGEVALHDDFIGKFGNKIEVGMPQFILGGTVNYNIAGLTLGAAFRQYKDIYILENNSDVLVGPGDDDMYFTDDDEKSATIPAASVIDLTVRYSLPVLNGINLSLHINNAMDTKYWQTGDSYGFKPGAARNVLFNLGIAF